MTLQYSVIRFSPRAGRGEILNIGVLVFDSITGRAEVSLSENRQRLRAISERQLVDSTIAYLSEWKQRVEGTAEDDSRLTVSERWLDEIAENGNNLVQFSPRAPILAGKMAEALELLAREFLPQNPKPRSHPDITRKRAISAVRNAYSSEGLRRGIDFVEKPMISTKNYGEVMDFAVANGSAVQLAQSWNFRQRNVGALSEAVKAWAWTILDIREHGGNGRLDRRSFKVPKDIDVEAVYIEPDDGAGEGAFAEAIRAFDEIGAKHSSMATPERLAQRAKRALVTSHRE